MPRTVVGVMWSGPDSTAQDVQTHLKRRKMRGVTVAKSLRPEIMSKFQMLDTELQDEIDTTR